jgi:energy-converting hydrogenase A subunit R
MEDIEGTVMNLIFFDMEGPLSIQDNAYELMRLFPNGGDIFEVISRYDDLLATEGREGYEPGDTLALIVPFLIHHGIAEEDISGLAEVAAIVEGAKELIASLKHWQVFCISTSYEQYANRIMQRVGIATEKLACTRFPIDRYRSLASKEDLTMMAEMEQEILALKAGDDKRIKQRLDRFFWEELPKTSLGLAIGEVKPMGGRRKAAALRRFARARGQFPEQVVVIGDSITDARMLETVNRAGGLAIAFNANEYSLPYATMGLASSNIGDLKIALDAWEEGGKEAVRQAIRQWDRERREQKGGEVEFLWLEGTDDLEKAIQIHKRIRRMVRQEAGRLG